MEQFPHLSCWERQAEGVDDGAQRSEARLDGLDVRRREQVQPGQEQTRTDVGLEQQPEVVELVFPAGAGVPGGVSLQQGGRRRFRCGGVPRGGGAPGGGCGGGGGGGGGGAAGGGGRGGGGGGGGGRGCGGGGGGGACLTMVGAPNGFSSEDDKHDAQPTTGTGGQRAAGIRIA